jgi:hypothetical protein
MGVDVGDVEALGRLLRRTPGSRPRNRAQSHC